MRNSRPNFSSRLIAPAPLPADRSDFGRLLDALMLDKALYELLYELNNRPDWVRIPLMGILHVIRAEDVPVAPRG